MSDGITKSRFDPGVVQLCSSDCCPEVEMFDDGSIMLSDDDGKNPPQVVMFSRDQAKRLAEFLHERFLQE